MKKSILRIALSALLVAVVLVGGTLAYLVTATDLLTNTFAVVDIDTEVKEPDPSTGAEKAPYVVNNSNVAVYVRAYAVVSTDEGSSVPVAASDVAINYEYTGTKWVYNSEDGYYYYTEAVPAAGVANNQTGPLFNGVVVNIEDKGARFSVYVYHESIQAKSEGLSVEEIKALFDKA